MIKAPADQSRKPKTIVFLLVLLILLAGCERPATLSNWSPIEEANQTATAAALPEELATGAPTHSAPTLTSAPVTTATITATPQMMGTLDVTQLPKTLPDSMKGYDLYSWQVGEEWNFTLITGTNRTKAFDELITPGNTVGPDGFIKVSVTGVAELKKLLKMLPTGEDILWGGMDLGGQVPIGTVYLTLPDQPMIDELATFCNGLGLHLTAIRPQN
jgi:hypothetical protein